MIKARAVLFLALCFLCNTPILNSKSTVKKTAIQDLEQTQSYFSEVEEVFQDERLLTFIKNFLSVRYAGLIGDNDETFESTEQYVDRMLASLKDGDIKKTRRTFFKKGVIKDAHKNIYGSTIGVKYDFDATPLIPFINSLESGATILDVGAGFNNFLPHVKQRVGRMDLNYYATDPFVEGKNKEGVLFIPQPSAYKLPDILCDIIVLRAALHHIENLDEIMHEIRTKLKMKGKLILIEDSFDDEDSSIWSDAKSMSNSLLNGQFYELTSEQKIRFFIFNDWYANHLYHKWGEMPLPFCHKSQNEWIGALSPLKMKFVCSFNMGFPNNAYAVHQPFTLIMVFQKDDLCN